MKQSTLILSIIIFILLITGGIFVWQGFQPVAPDDGATPTINPTPTDGIPEGWKTYRNEELGFELAYPEGWFVYDRETFLRDNGGPNSWKCGATGGDGMENTVVLSRKDLGTCVDLTYDGAPVVDMTVRSFLSTTPTAPDYYINQPGREIIIIDGVQAEKVPTLSTTTIEQRANITSIGFNYKERSYSIYLSQTDHNGYYDPIFDQILSTFHFLD